MDILVTHVYDISRFAWYLAAKLHINGPMLNTAKMINHNKPLKITGLPECDVMYLQRDNITFGRICNLKILSTMSRKNVSSIPPYLDNEKKAFEAKVEEMYNGTQLYSVTYTELVTHKSAMTKQEIDKLLTNPNVKSININKQ